MRRLFGFLPLLGIACACEAPACRTGFTFALHRPPSIRSEQIMDVGGLSFAEHGRESFGLRAAPPGLFVAPEDFETSTFSFPSRARAPRSFGIETNALLLELQGLRAELRALRAPVCPPAPAVTETRELPAPRKMPRAVPPTCP